MPRDRRGASRRPPLSPTSLSLLDRLKVARPGSSDWNRLQGVYLPLIRQWLCRVPGLGDESADLAQEVLVDVFREVPRFDRRREGSFRAWLRQVTVNKVRNYRRKRLRRPAVGLDPAYVGDAGAAGTVDALMPLWFALVKQHGGNRRIALRIVQ